jgi:hypothetical protein
MFGLVSCVIYLAASRVEGAGFGAGVDVVVGGYDARVGVVVLVSELCEELLTLGHDVVYGVFFGGVVFVRSELDGSAVDVVVGGGRRRCPRREVAGIRGGGCGGVASELRWRLRR